MIGSSWVRVFVYVFAVSSRISPLPFFLPPPWPLEHQRAPTQPIPPTATPTLAPVSSLRHACGTQQRGRVRGAVFRCGVKEEEGEGEGTGRPETNPPERRVRCDDGVRGRPQRGEGRVERRERGCCGERGGGGGEGRVGGEGEGVVWGRGQRTCCNLAGAWSS
ncbi:hypothetical protein B0H13DRAFT_2030112 [Mycena leptocephala]|nr:hypothetical protein B0H13DRAFT_2030112 [Mycena leptocephala]